MAHSQARAIQAPTAANRRKTGLLNKIADHFSRYWQLWILASPALCWHFASLTPPKA